jgi:hypothetical protein
LNTFCTIITPDYLAYAFALYESLKANSKTQVRMCVLISNSKTDSNISLPKVEGIKYLFIEDLCEEGVGKAIKDKYFLSDIHAFRWSMKSVLINYLLQIEKYEKVIFLDGDIFIFSDYQFLFDKLNHARVLLTPHWRSFDPKFDKFNFRLMFNNGIYNAGFIAVNRNATPVMDWWGNSCVFSCVKEPTNGLFADQTYLNLFNVIFEGIEIVRHKGCNVANWNQIECKRVRRSDGQVWINDEYPVVFIHFTESTIKGILNGKDRHLLPYLELYAQTLKKYDSNLDILRKYSADSEVKQSKSGLSSAKKYLHKWFSKLARITRS